MMWLDGMASPVPATPLLLRRVVCDRACGVCALSAFPVPRPRVSAWPQAPDLFIHVNHEIPVCLHLMLLLKALLKKTRVASR